MSIASEITRIKDNISNAYDAIEAKGGTVPTEANSANLADAVESVPGEKIKYGMTIDNMMGNVDSSGAYSEPSMNFTPDFSSIKTVPTFSFYYKFYSSTATSIGVSGVLNFGLTSGSTGNAFGSCFRNRQGITAVNIPYMTSVSGSNFFSNTFSDCKGITSVNLALLESVTGSTSCGNMFSGCSNIDTVDIHSWTTITGTSAVAGMFKDCKKLTSVNLDNLTTVGSTSTNYAMQDTFNGCNLQEIELPALKTVAGTSAMVRCFANNVNMVEAFFSGLEEILPTTTQNQFTNMFQNNTNMVAIHFPAAMQSRIEQLSGYSTKFGATNATIYFDL